MDARNFIDTDNRGGAIHAPPQSQTGSAFLPLQWVRALWKGDVMTGRVCRAIEDEAGGALYEVELPNVFGCGGKRLHVMRAANEIEAIPETVVV